MGAIHILGDAESATPFCQQKKRRKTSDVLSLVTCTLPTFPLIISLFTFIWWMVRYPSNPIDVLWFPADNPQTYLVFSQLIEVCVTDSDVFSFFESFAQSLRFSKTHFFLNVSTQLWLSLFSVQPLSCQEIGQNRNFLLFLKGWNGYSLLRVFSFYIEKLVFFFSVHDQ